MVVGLVEWTGVGIVRPVNEDEVRAGLATTPSYRYAEVEGRQLFVAGQVPRDTSGNLVGIGNSKQQSISCLNNLRTLVEVHGFAVNDIRQLTIYVVGEHQNLLDAWDAVVSWFEGDVPPATLLGVNLLGYAQQLVEIDAIVVQRGDA